MPRVYVSVGSNVEPVRHIQAALASLAAHYGDLGVSPVYESRALGFHGGNFLNLVVSFETEEAPSTVAGRLKAVEAAEGRSREGPRFSDRTLDLDLILYGDAVLTDGTLQVPRPEVLEHAHVLRPLADLAGDRRHPLTGRTYAALWAAFDRTDQSLWPVDVDLLPRP
jgi:2-amino-4-hydroxy-6-hydroxymethyldihydropteridine diphosphokinase